MRSITLPEVDGHLLLLTPIQLPSTLRLVRLTTWLSLGAPLLEQLVSSSHLNVKFGCTIGLTGMASVGSWQSFHLQNYLQEMVTMIGKPFVGFSLIILIVTFHMVEANGVRGLPV